MTKAIIHEIQTERAERQISTLQAKRDRVYSCLQGVYDAVTALIRKKPDLPDIEPFLLLGNDLRIEEKVKNKAWEVWLRIENLGVVIPSQAESALGRVPDEVAAVIAAWKALDQEGTQDPMKYWSASRQEFKALNVTLGEKEQIEERNKMVINKKDFGEVLEFARVHVKALNFTGVYKGNTITPARLKDQHAWLHPLVSWKDVIAPNGNKAYQYFLREDLFLTPKTDYLAFEETRSKWIHEIRTVGNYVPME